ncbi:MAG: aminoacyl-tRNA hydrolase [Candidatus Magasanikbacteria bacterium]
MKLIVGLGNPGKQYEKTRHNVGFMILDALHDALSEYSINTWELSKKFNAYVAGCTMHGEKIILAKPLTFMNASGETIQLIAHFYQLSHDDLVIVHDDKDIKLGEIKIQKDRGDAGHNGIKSVIEHIGSKNFMRVRVGIAPEDEKRMRKDVPKFVLGKFSMFEKKKVEQTIDNAIQNIMSLL